MSMKGAGRWRAWQIILLGVLISLASLTRAQPPSAEDVEAAKQVLRDIHAATEAKYGEVSDLPLAEQERALDTFVEETMRRYLDLQHMLPRIFPAYWTGIESNGLQALAKQAAIVVMRDNIRTAFESYERRARLNLLRVQTDRESRDQVWLSGTVGSPTTTSGNLPFTFIAKFHQTRNGKWAGVDLNFLGASLLGFARSNAQVLIEAQGLEPALKSLAAKSATQP